MARYLNSVHRKNERQIDTNYKCQFQVGHNTGGGRITTICGEPVRRGNRYLCARHERKAMNITEHQSMFEVIRNSAHRQIVVEGKH